MKDVTRGAVTTVPLRPTKLAHTKSLFHFSNESKNGGDFYKAAVSSVSGRVTTDQGNQGKQGKS